MTYTQRAIIVARTSFADRCNTAAKQVDTAGGEHTFTVPLRQAGDATNTVRAYWANWQMTPEQVTALRTRLKAQGLLDDEVRVVRYGERGTFKPNRDARAYIFAVENIQQSGAGGVVLTTTGWSPQEVLDVLNLDTLAASIP